MILTVTLNLALDVTYAVDRFERGSTTRVAISGKRAGGKGVNVARVLRALGREVVVTGLAGGFAGDAARHELSASGLRDETVSISGESRQTIIVVEAGGSATGFSEPGAEVSASEWRRLVARFASLVGEAEAVALSGSLPPGIPDDAYAQLIMLAAAAGVPVLVDAGGDALRQAVRAGPSVVKVNVSELEGVLPGLDPLAGGAQLRRDGARAAVISDGEKGLIGHTGDGIWRAAPPEHVAGNPTGAGDAAAAALIVGVVEGTPWPERLADAAALSAAAVAAPLAGSFDERLYREFSGRVVARPVAS